MLQIDHVRAYPFHIVGAVPAGSAGIAGCNRNLDGAVRQLWVRRIHVRHAAGGVVIGRVILVAVSAGPKVHQRIVAIRGQLELDTVGRADARPNPSVFMAAPYRHFD